MLEHALSKVSVCVCARARVSVCMGVDSQGFLISMALIYVPCQCAVCAGNEATHRATTSGGVVVSVNPHNHQLLQLWRNTASAYTMRARHVASNETTLHHTLHREVVSGLVVLEAGGWGCSPRQEPAGDMDTHCWVFMRLLVSGQCESY